MSETIVFGGTSEGRIIAQALYDMRVPAIICCATPLGEEQLSVGRPVEVMTGRMDARAMRDLLVQHGSKLVIDATHPYAVEVSRNVKEACKQAGTPYVRVVREVTEVDGVACFMTLDDLVAWLNTQEGTVFVTLGAKEAREMRNISDFEERVYLRMLPSPEGISASLGLGFPSRHIVAMQGPFSQRLNEAMFEEVHAAILVTKASGHLGGYQDKVAAARACGMKVAVLAKPPADEEGISLDEALQMLRGRFA